MSCSRSSICGSDPRSFRGASNLAFSRIHRSTLSSDSELGGLAQAGSDPACQFGFGGMSGDLALSPEFSQCSEIPSLCSPDSNGQAGLSPEGDLADQCFLPNLWCLSFDADSRHDTDACFNIPQEAAVPRTRDALNADIVSSGMFGDFDSCTSPEALPHDSYPTGNSGSHGCSMSLHESMDVADYESFPYKPSLSLSYKPSSNTQRSTSTTMVGDHWCTDTSRTTISCKADVTSHETAPKHRVDSQTTTIRTAISREPLRRRPKPKIFCPDCQEYPDGYRGTHELTRHQERRHSEERSVWLCSDPTPDKGSLKHCKHCRDGKHYGAYYNAAAHLRRAHFKPSRTGRPSRNGRKPKALVNMFVQDDAGMLNSEGFPTIEWLKQNGWLKEVKLSVNGSPALKDECAEFS